MKTKNETVNREPNTVEPAQHTPGPWGVIDNGGDVRPEAIYAPEAGGYIVATTWAIVKESQRKANARLIAAAPELLAALEMALGPLQDAYNQAGHSGHSTNASRAFVAARAAIAQAKGN